MTHTSRLLLLAIAMALYACNTPQPEPDKQALTQEITARFGQFAEHMNTLNAEGLADFYSADSRFYWVEDGQVQYDQKSAVTASLNGLLAQVESTELRVLQTRVEVMDQQSAMLYAEYEQPMTLKSGVTFSINGAMTVLLQKEAHTWRFLIGHSSSKKQRGT